MTAIGLFPVAHNRGGPGDCSGPFLSVLAHPFLMCQGYHDNKESFEQIFKAFLGYRALSISNK
jgi:hypothetical protein